MKKRHVLAVLGLSFVTLGFYVLYWLYKTRKELLGYLPDKKAIPRVIVLFIPMFVMIGVFICMGVITSSVPYGSPAYDTASVLSVILAILSILAIFVVSFWWFYRYFKAVEAVTQGNDAMLLYTLWIILTLLGLGPVWVLIVQNDFNKFIENGYQPLKPTAYPSYPQGPQQWQQPTQPQYGQPYPPAPPYPYQAPQAPNYQQPYPQYPQQPAPEHHQHHSQHSHHEQHHPHSQGHHGHPDQPHDETKS